ncbi:MAG TPA: cytochrome c biogenesis protein [Thermoplasmata archaeon]|nr:cytochrome c biogenesis protein [Thermoplasmata archaeon]
MRRGALAAVVAVAVVAFALAPTSYAAGSPAPDFSLTDIDGNHLNLTTFRGKILLMDFMYIGCASCELARPVLEDVYAAYPGVLEGLSLDIYPTDTLDMLRTYRDQKGIPWHIARDTDQVMQKYNVGPVVRLFLVDQNGYLIFDKEGMSIGEQASLRASLEATIDAALRGEAPGIQLQQLSIYALAALAAVGSFFSPCSFPMFPGYMAFFLGIDSEHPEGRSRKRSVAFGVISSLGIILVYGMIGVVVLAIGAAATAVVPALQPIVGGILIAMGVLMFTAVQFNFLVNPFRKVRQRLFPSWTPNTVQSTSGKLFSYGVGYGAAGFGCVAPPFIAAVLNATTLGGPLSGLTVLLVYALIVIGIMIAVTFVLATLGQAALKKINRYTETIKKVSAVVLIIAGIYLVYYWYAAWVAT